MYVYMQLVYSISRTKPEAYSFGFQEAERPMCMRRSKELLEERKIV